MEVFMKFGFDIDDTLINLREHAFHIYNQKLNKNLDLSVFRNIKRVEIHEPFGLSEQEGNQMWKDTLEEIYYTDCPPFPHAIETVRKLYDNGHKIYYITSRPKEHEEGTKKWMKERGFPILDEHFYCGMRDNEKVHIIKQLELDFYADDKPTVLETLYQESTTLLLKDQPYNQDIKNLIRVYDWSDFYNEYIIK